MKASLILSVSALAFVLLGCGGKANNEKPEENNQNQVAENDIQNPGEVQFDVFDDVDWDRPLFSLNAEGDTVETWRYDELGNLVSYNLEEEDGFRNTNDYSYDAWGRLVRVTGSSFSGNTREFYEDYTYADNMRISRGDHFTEGYPSYFKVKEVRYFMDDDFKYDTLCQEYEAELSWDEYIEDEEDFDESLLNLARYSTKKYTEVKGELKVSEECFYYEDGEHPGKYNLGYKTINIYNDQGLLVGNISQLADGAETRTDYSYQGNVKDGLTYYARKSDFKPYAYVEPKEDIVRKVAEQLLPEEYLDGLRCQGKTIATVDVDLDETETIACYQCFDGSWTVLTYSPIHSPEDDCLGIYSYDGSNLTTGDATHLPLVLEVMQLSGHQLFFPYQGDELQFGKDYFIFPIEDKQPLRLEWTGAQFVVKK